MAKKKKAHYTEIVKPELFAFEVEYLHGDVVKSVVLEAERFRSGCTEEPLELVIDDVVVAAFKNWISCFKYQDEDQE